MTLKFYLTVAHCQISQPEWQQLTATEKEEKKGPVTEPEVLNGNAEHGDKLGSWPGWSPLALLLDFFCSFSALTGAFLQHIVG